ncbi:MAG: hypothetical protein K0S10_2290, partial [Rubrobacteraceae bacterium]|nr:hypothetical protein [Rubrobacteraceae bacterium]
MLLENKNAVIYGGGDAVGAGVTYAFAREGARESTRYIFTRRVRITAPFIERALKFAGQGKPGRLRPLMRNSPMRIGPKMSHSPCPVRLPWESETHGDRMDGGPRMRLPNTAHTSRPWRIHELTRDFRLEDVWALP